MGSLLHMNDRKYIGNQQVNVLGQKNKYWASGNNLLGQELLLNHRRFQIQVIFAIGISYRLFLEKFQKSVLPKLILY